MLLYWITLGLSLTWPGTTSFTLHSTKEGLCLEDSSEGVVELRACSLDSVLQQWTWTDRWFLVNAGTRRCLSAVHTGPVRTGACDSGEHIKWQCEAQQLIGLQNSLALSTERGKLRLSAGGHDAWESLDAGNICHDKLRSRRESDSEDDEFDFAEGPPKPRMTEAEMKFLQWYYRTEEQTSWKFGMLAFAFLGLLMGAMLLVIGMMANRNRKQIAKYKAASKFTEAKPETEKLQVIVPDEVAEVKEEKSHFTPSEHISTNNSHRGWEEPSYDSAASEGLKPGEIVVTWKDGNVSTLYPEPAEEGQAEEDVHNTDEETLSQIPQVIASSEAIAF
ncbi:solute carrier family 51 subunit beta [Puntigrus tetrazona]|uniref:solute carrier family 51 subunit beta n=1 Tax=Puntigrus tetrazona TaxID=1606681 RepID=UPI001C891F96|nr:solute carrier family 51 subunit beta [Puntigrus tetrazona]XP_043101287.1 solute carrier family 51 subunit beta [Puntigrus tetrazona]XP_043101288.1 solute carrier family 51 subunit beta [Puntigrus tetrazona]